MAGTSRGNLLELVDDLIDCGVTIHDPQARANTIDGIAQVYKGKMCIRLDLDQQLVLPFGTPEDVDAHVREGVEKLNAPEGGLTVICGGGWQLKARATEGAQRTEAMMRSAMAVGRGTLRCNPTRWPSKARIIRSRPGCRDSNRRS